MKSHYPQTAIMLAKSFAEKGRDLDDQLSENHLNLLSRFPEADYFDIGIAASLTWSQHAVDKGNYYLSVLEYLRIGNNSILSEAGAFAGRFGEESLIRALKGWRDIRVRLQFATQRRSSVAEIKNTQQECIRVAEKLRREGVLSGVGAWLLFGPFKIIIAHRKDLWKNKEIDEIMMPLGIEVIRGVNRLIKSGSPFVENTDKTMIWENEGGLEEGLGTVTLVHSISRDIAELDATRVIHVNSGLFLYGKHEL